MIVFGIKLNFIINGYMDLVVKNDFMLMLMYVYWKNLKKNKV